MDMLLFSYFIMMSLVIVSLVLVQGEREDKKKSRIESYVHMRAPKEEAHKVSKKDIKVKFKDQFKGITQKLRKYYNTAKPTHKEDELQLKLLRAGSPLKMTVADYYIINNILRIAVPLLFVAVAIVLKLKFAQIVLVFLLGFVASFKTFDAYLSIKTRERNKKALRELPDFLDILTISVEAGLGFDLALSRTIEKRNGVLPIEFNTCLEEMRLGKTRKDALTGVKDRLNFEEMASFVNSIIQSEKLGTGIVQTLRAKSEDERDKRKQRAEEQAMKMTIKILIPLIVFIFPSIFIIALGPALLKMFNNTGGLF